MTLTIFGGKGGVGKTSCAAATAIQYALIEEKTLLLSADPAHSLSDCLNQTIGNRIKKVSGLDSLSAIEIDADKNLLSFKEEFGQHIKEILSTATYLDETDLEDIGTLSIPGLDEVIALIKMLDFIEANEFDRYVLDTAPTGHALRLLEMPELLDHWIKILAKLRLKYIYFVSRFSGRSQTNSTDDFLFNMKKSIKKLYALFQDPQQCHFVVVTLPERIVIDETRRLITALSRQRIPAKQILINRVLVTDESNCRVCRRKSEEQQRYIAEVRDTFTEFRVDEIPEQDNQVRGLEHLRKFKCLLGNEYERKRLQGVASF